MRVTLLPPLLIAILAVAAPMRVSAQDNVSTSLPAPTQGSANEGDDTTHLMRLRRLSPQQAAEVLSETYPDRHKDLVHIVAKEGINALILRGPKKLVVETAALVDELERSADASIDHDISLDFRPDIEVPSPAVPISAPAVPHPPMLAGSGDAFLPVHQELHRAEAFEHQHRLEELARKHRALTQEGKDEAAEDIKSEIRNMIEASHERRQAQQREQLERLHQRLEALEQRMEEREEHREQVIDDAVESVLAARKLQLHFTKPPVPPHPELPGIPHLGSMELQQRLGAKHPEVVIEKAKERANLEVVRIQMEQASKLRAIDLRQAEAQLRQSMVELEQMQLLKKQGTIPTKEIRAAESTVEQAKLQLERAKIQLDGERRKLELYLKRIEPSSGE